MNKSSLIPLYFAPDLDPSWEVNPGVLTEVRNMVPTSRGTLQNYVCTDTELVDDFDAYTDASFTTNGNVAVSAAILKSSEGFSSGSSRLILGTTTKLFSNSSTTAGSYTLNDVTRTTGGDYSATEWVFDNYGNKVIATEWVGGGTATGTPQTSTGTATTKFGNLTTSAPRAQLCCVQKGMLLLANVSDGSTTLTDGWMCSGLYNVNSWTTLGGAANLTTQANNGRLLETPGPICALVKQRDYVVAYKPNSIYIGQYTGNPYGWSWRLITNEVGQSTPNGVAVVNGLHYFLHSSGVYVFDGSYPKNIGTGVVNNYIQRVMSSDITWGLAIRTAVDERRGIIYWFFSTYDGGQFDPQTTTDRYYFGPFGLAYNYISNKFGFITRTTDDVVNAFVPINASRDKWRSFRQSVASDVRQDYVSFLTIVQNASNQIELRLPRVGAPPLEGNTQSFIVTGDIGSEQSFTKMLRVQPSFVSGDDNDQSAECYVDSKNAKADDYDGLGYVLEATATGTGASGALYGPMLRNETWGDHTIASGDHLTFEVMLEEGSTSTQAGVKLTSNAAGGTATNLTGTVSALDAWETKTLGMTAHAGGVITGLNPFLGQAGATGLHRMVVRNLRITDSSGTLRRRLAKGNEARYTYFILGSAISSYENPKAYIRQSHGAAYTYDTNKRRWDGSKTGKVHRIKMGFYNGTEIDGVYLTTQTVGSE